MAGMQTGVLLHDMPSSAPSPYIAPPATFAGCNFAYFPKLHQEPLLAAQSRCSSVDRASALTGHSAAALSYSLQTDGADV